MEITSLLLLLLLTLVIAPSSSAASVRDLIDKDHFNDEDIATYLDQQYNHQWEQRDEHSEFHRHLQTEDAEGRFFGERCGNKNACANDMECTRLNILMGNRCLPNKCLQEQMAFRDSFDLNAYKSKLYQSADISEEQVLKALSLAKSQRDFLESPEFVSLQQALQQNQEPLQAMQQLRQSCIKGRSEERTVSYMGFHIEAGLFLDGSLDYLAATNGPDQRSVIRLCLGAELGAGAEISFIFGFTNTILTENMVCGSIFADVDLAIIASAGTAVGIGFNQVFFYEFTFGGGLGVGLGGGACASLEYGVASIPTTKPPTNPPTFAPTIYSPAPTIHKVSGRLRYAFSVRTEIREPTNAEVNSLIEQTYRFYSDFFRKTWPSNFVSFSMTNIIETFDSNDGYPVALDFDSLSTFSTDSANTPGPRDIFGVMARADYVNYVENYVYATGTGDGSKPNIFLQTRIVLFEIRKI